MSYKPAVINVPFVLLGGLTYHRAILSAVKCRCSCMCGVYITNTVSSIKHSCYIWWLQKLQVTNGKGEDTVGFKMTTSHCSSCLCLPQVSMPGKSPAAYTLMKEIIFGDDRWKPADLLISSILFIIIHDWKVANVANPAMLLCWKNGVINRCQNWHSSGNWDFSISGHWRITQAHSWPALSVSSLYISAQWQRNYGRTDSWQETPGSISKRSYQNKDSPAAKIPESTYLLSNFTVVILIFGHPV